MDVEAEVTDANSNDDKRGYNAAVNGDTPPKSSIPQRGDGPKNDCERSCDRKNARKGLIDLKNSGNHDLPLMLIGNSIPQHMLQNVRDNESADRSAIRAAIAAKP